jgi:hypothetical protein
MSSPEKDARWNLAMKMVEVVDIEWADLTYSQTVDLLSIAQSELDRHPERVEIEASEWNSR